MTVVYIDLLFMLNFVANYLLLLGTGRVVGTVLLRWRIALGGAAGALYAAAIFLPGMGWLALWPCKVAAGVLMVLISFGGERRLVRILLFFFAASAGLAGGVMALEMLGGTSLEIKQGVFYSQFDLRLLLLLFVLCYFIMSLFFRRAGKAAAGGVIQLRLEFEQGETVVTALRDTGNSLTDPVNNRPVIVAEYGCLVNLLPAEIDAREPIESVKRCHAAGIGGVRLIPYRAVGVECGMLVAVKAKAVTAEGKKMGELFVALSPTPVDDGAGYQALIGAA